MLKNLKQQLRQRKSTSRPRRRSHQTSSPAEQLEMRTLLTKIGLADVYSSGGPSLDLESSAAKESQGTTATGIRQLAPSTQIGFQPTVVNQHDVNISLATEQTVSTSSAFSGVVALSINRASSAAGLGALLGSGLPTASGVRISRRHIVTAAHNFDLQQSPASSASTGLGDGTRDVSPGNVYVHFNTTERQVTFEVESITMHYSWDGYLNTKSKNNLNDDIAVLRLKDVSLDGTLIDDIDAAPYELDDSGTEEVQKIIVAGYGQRGGGDLERRHPDLEESEMLLPANTFEKVIGLNTVSSTYRDDDGTQTAEVWIADLDKVGTSQFDTLEDGEAVPTITVDGLTLSESGIGPGDSGGAAFTYNDENNNGQFDSGEKVRWWGNLTANNPVPYTGVGEGFLDDKPFPKYGSWFGGMIGAAYGRFLQLSTIEFGEPQFYDIDGQTGTRVPFTTAAGVDLIEGSDFRLQQVNGTNTTEYDLQDSHLITQDAGQYSIDLGTLAATSATYHFLTQPLPELAKGALPSTSWVKESLDTPEAQLQVEGNEAGAWFGSEFALSDDGVTMVVAAQRADTGSGVDSQFSVGRVSIFEYLEDSWHAAASFEGDAADDGLGSAVAISADGTTVAASSTVHDHRGQVKIFQKHAGQWGQIAEIHGAMVGDYAGYDLALSGNGRTLAVSALGNDSGHVRIFDETDSGNWSEVAELIGEGPSEHFGSAVSLSDDGNTIAIGARHAVVDRYSLAGRVDLFERTSSGWSRTAQFGSPGHSRLGDSRSVSLSGNGRILVIGGRFHEESAGHVRIYVRSGGGWELRQEVVGVRPGQLLGLVDANYDGTVIAIGDGETTRVFRSVGQQWAPSAEYPGGFFRPFALAHDGDQLAVGYYQNDSSSVGRIELTGVPLTDGPKVRLIRPQFIANGALTVRNGRARLNWGDVPGAVIYEIRVTNRETDQSASITTTAATIDLQISVGSSSVFVRGISADGLSGPWSPPLSIQSVDETQLPSSLEKVHYLPTPAFDGPGADLAIVVEGLELGQSFSVSVATLSENAPVLTSIGTRTNTLDVRRFSGLFDLEVAGIDAINGGFVVIESDEPIAIASVDVIYPDLGTLPNAEVLTPATGQVPAIQDPVVSGATYHIWNGSAFRPITDLSAVDWSRPTHLLTHGSGDKLDDDVEEAEYMVRYARNLPNVISDAGAVNVIALDWELAADPDFDASSLLEQLEALRNPAFAPLQQARDSASNGIRVGRGVADELLAAWTDKQQIPSELRLIGHSNGGGLMASLATELLSPNSEKNTGGTRRALDELVASLNTQLPDTKLITLDTPAAWLTPAGAALRTAAASVPELQVANYFVQVGLFLGGPGLNHVVNHQTRKNPLDLELDHNELPLRFADSSNWMDLGYHDTAFASPGIGRQWLEADTLTQVQDDAVNDFNSAAATYSTAAFEGIQDGATTFWDALKATGNTIGDAVRNSASAINSWIQIPPSSLQTDLQIRGRANSPVNMSIDVDIPDDADLLTFNIHIANSGNNDVLYVMAGDDVLREIDLTTWSSYGTSTHNVNVEDIAGTAETIHFYMPSPEDVSSDADFTLSSLQFVDVEEPVVGLTADIIDVSPDPRSQPVGEVVIEYSEDVAPLEIDEFQLTRNGQSIDITGLTLNGSGARYSIDLSSVTTLPGDYELRLVAEDSDAITDDGEALTEDVVETFTITANGLVDYGAAGEFFFDPATELFWFDPAQWLDTDRTEIDSFVQSTNWDWASFQQVDGLLGTTPAGGGSLIDVMGPATLRLTQGGYRWMGYYDGNGTGATSGGWHVQTDDISTSNEITDTGFQGNAADYNPGAWLVTTIDPLSGIVRLTAPTESTRDQTPEFQWTESTNAVSYELWVNDEERTRVIHERGLTGTSFTPTTNLSVGNFDVWVRPTFSNDEQGEWSDAYRFAVVTDSQPSVPTIEVPDTSGSNRRPTFRWSMPSAADHYELWVTEVSTGTRVLHETDLNGTSFVPSVDLADGYYRIWMRAFSSGGLESEWTPESVFTIGTLDAPPKPVLSGPAATSADATPTFTWTTDPATTHVELWVNSRTESRVVHEKGLTGNSFTTNDLAPGVYRAWMRSYGENGQASDWTEELKFIVEGTAPIPGSTSILEPQTATTSSRPTIQWEAASNAAQYELWIDHVESQSKVVHLSDIDGTGHALEEDLSSGNYVAWVRGHNSDNLPGPWSQPFSFQIAAAPAVPVLNSPSGTVSGGIPQFVWTPVADAAGYELWVNNLDEDRVAIHEQSLKDPAFTPDASLVPGSYRSWVRTIAASGVKSDWSLALDFQMESAGLPGLSLRDMDALFASPLELSAEQIEVPV